MYRFFTLIFALTYSSTTLTVDTYASSTLAFNILTVGAQNTAIWFCINFSSLQFVSSCFGGNLTGKGLPAIAINTCFIC